jgi:hypothetical protein
VTLIQSPKGDVYVRGLLKFQGAQPHLLGWPSSTISATAGLDVATACTRTHRPWRHGNKFLGVHHWFKIVCPLIALLGLNRWVATMLVTQKMIFYVVYICILIYTYTYIHIHKYIHVCICILSIYINMKIYIYIYTEYCICALKIIICWYVYLPTVYY